MLRSGFSYQELAAALARANRGRETTTPGVKTVNPLPNTAVANVPTQ
jgi:hypothetical protein